MAPTRLQRFFADDWPGLIWIWTWTVCVVALFALGILPGFRFDLKGTLYFALLMVAAILLAAITGGIFFGIFVVPFYRWQGARNGAPFRVGDEVMILSRRHRGRVTRVYEVWEGRHQVRVELGEDAKKAVTDVLSYVEVCRCTSATPKSAPPSTSDSDQKTRTGY
jgi:hypothetical protein